MNIEPNIHNTEPATRSRTPLSYLPPNVCWEVGGRAKNGSTPRPRRLSVKEGEREREVVREREREVVRERK